MGPTENGGATRNRTEDILLAKQTLYQLSYGPEWNNGWLTNAAHFVAITHQRFVINSIGVF